MAAIIASIAAFALIGTSFYALVCATRARDKEKRRMPLEAVVLEFKPRRQQSANSGRG
ncbi:MULTISPECIES: hypothetical protein [Rhizobium]|uniref:Uncharacterized protein n=1 Tax=Rhizobium lusitanum TaxID=293958 RepID=A0A1C3UE40_9HYPH|nr:MULTISPECIES: hypothetical protein [Rhizobium]NKJ35899.1 hypothetical protein [Rhizobium sp. SG570]SCB13714.1 hypothetical protein GA0061101_102199 [Rhizobium lusitanum]